jgi:hypothetical protein
LGVKRLVVAPRSSSPRTSGPSQRARSADSVCLKCTQRNATHADRIMTTQQASTLFSLFGATVMTIAMLVGMNGLATGEGVNAAVAAQAVASPSKA